jgi:hypothetical protein
MYIIVLHEDFSIFQGFTTLATVTKESAATCSLTCLKNTVSQQMFYFFKIKVTELFH